MAQDTHKDYKLTIILVALAIIVVAGILVILVWGWQGIFKFLFVLLEIIMGLSLVFGLLYLFYYIFLKKQKYDVQYVNLQKLIDASTRIKRPLLKDLYVSGDKGHSRGLVGTIQGYCRIQVLTRNYLYKEITTEDGVKTKELITHTNDRGEKIPQYTLDKIEQDVFVVKQKGLAGMFQDPMVIRCDPDSHDQLVGDITLWGYSLIPIGQYWFLNTDHLDVRKIDYAILKEAERTIAFATLSDVKELIDRATGIDAKHKKFIEAKSLVDIPETQSIGQQNSPYA
jgi:hypothetical protein